MSYATIDDIDSIYPGLLGRIAYDRSAQAIDTQVVNAALDSATTRINVFLSQRYVLPLAPVPQSATEMCVDLAVYRICLTRDKLTTEMRQRYEDVIDILKLIAAGKAGIGNPALDDTTGQPNSAGGQDANNGRAIICLMRRQG